MPYEYKLLFIYIPLAVILLSILISRVCSDDTAEAFFTYSWILAYILISAIFIDINNDKHFGRDSKNFESEVINISPEKGSQDSLRLILTSETLGIFSVSLEAGSDIESLQIGDIVTYTVDLLDTDMRTMITYRETTKFSGLYSLEENDVAGKELLLKVFNKRYEDGFGRLPN